MDSNEVACPMCSKATLSSRREVQTEHGFVQFERFCTQCCTVVAVLALKKVSQTMQEAAEFVVKTTTPEEGEQSALHRRWAQMDATEWWDV